MKVSGGSIQEAQKQGYHVEKHPHHLNPNQLKLVASPSFTSQLDLPIPPSPRPLFLSILTTVEPLLWDTSIQGTQNLVPEKC